MTFKKRHSLIVIIMTIAVLLFASTSIALAKTDVKKIVYVGSGKATVYFEDSVKYDDEVKASAKDNANTTYTVNVKSKSESKLQIQIKGYKAGKTYKVTIKGIKSGDAVCSFKIVAKSKAAQTAKSKSKATGITGIKTKSDKYNGYAIWRVTYEGTLSGTKFKFTYLIKQQTGQVMYSKREAA